MPSSTVETRAASLTQFFALRLRRRRTTLICISVDLLVIYFILFVCLPYFMHEKEIKISITMAIATVTNQRCTHTHGKDRNAPAIPHFWRQGAADHSVVLHRHVQGSIFSACLCEPPMPLFAFVWLVAETGVDLLSFV